jgi:hypothetical protein
MGSTIDMERFLGRAVAELRRLFPEVAFEADLESFRIDFPVNGRRAFLNLDNAYHAECVALLADALGEPGGLMTGCEYLVRAYQAVANRPRFPGRPTPSPVRRRRPSSRRQLVSAS